MAKETQCDCEEGAPAWMATFGDMMSLLLTFFVLLLSFSTQDVQNFRAMLGSVKEALGVESARPGPFEGRTTSMALLTDREVSPTGHNRRFSDERLKQFKSKAEEKFEQAGYADRVKVLLTVRGAVIRLDDAQLFDSGSARLRPEALKLLNVVGEIFDAEEGPIAVEAHTDDRPIHTPEFPSNWELSAGRAAAAMRYLVKGSTVDPARISVAGYADYHPVAPNDSAEHRALNRRVEFILLRWGGPSGAEQHVPVNSIFRGPPGTTK